MIKFLVFFVLGAASVYFLIRAFVNSDPGKLSRLIKTILIIILSVSIFGILFFILVRNALKIKLDILVEEEKKRKSDKLD